MMKMNRFGMVFALAMLGTASSAYAFDVEGYGGLNFSNTSLTPTPPFNASAKAGVIVGAGLGLSALPMVTIEGDVLFTNRKIDATVGTSDVVTTFKYVEIPVMARVDVIPMVTLGAGFYFAAASGDVNIETTSGGLTSTATQTYGSQSRGTSDFGMLGVVGIHMPIVPMLSFRLDGRYLFGFTNISQVAANTEKWKSLEILAGLSFGI